MELRINIAFGTRNSLFFCQIFLFQQRPGGLSSIFKNQPSFSHVITYDFILTLSFIADDIFNSIIFFFFIFFFLKLIVAVEQEEIPRLQALYERLAEWCPGSEADPAGGYKKEGAIL